MNLLRCRVLLRSFVSSPCLRLYHGTPSIAQKVVDPLRILFCGSDDFSAVSLRRLADLNKKEPNIVESIDVVCRKGKRSGRGMRDVREVPIKQVTKEIGLPVHEIPTFTGWAPPRPNGLPINLIIAVSFGLRVPPRILDGAKYGGLNVHPSLLPSLRGPAPLHHTLLQDLRRSGITLQTLHPSSFDHGQILRYDAVTLSPSNTRDLSTLQEYMAPRSADLLICGLREGLFVPPVTPLDPHPGVQESHAPKLTQEAAHIDWHAWDSDRILRTQKAMAPLWNRWQSGTREGEDQELRVQWQGLRLWRTDDKTWDGTKSVGVPSVVMGIEIREKLGGQAEVDEAIDERRVSDPVLMKVGGIPTIDGKFLVPDSVTIEGGKARRPDKSTLVVERLWKLAAKAHQQLR